MTRNETTIAVKRNLRRRHALYKQGWINFNRVVPKPLAEEIKSYCLAYKLKHPEHYQRGNTIA